MTKTKLAAIVVAVMLLAAGGALLNRHWLTTHAPDAPAETASAPTIAIPTILPVTTGDAASLYLRAAELIKVHSPSSSILDYPEGPPYGKAWDDLAGKAWEENAPARTLIRQARAESVVNWPVDPGMQYFNSLRKIANELGDAALFAQHRGEESASLEFIADLRHLVSALQRDPDAHGIMRLLVAKGIEALAMNRIKIIAPGLFLRDQQQVDVVRRLITDLLDQPSIDNQIQEGMRGEPAGAQSPALQEIIGNSMKQLRESIRGANAERTFAAMSLACQLYRIEKGDWPAKIEDIVPEYLPAVPVDPYGDGQQTFGYELIKAGTPDGSDRPVVFNRCESEKGLKPPRTSPAYGFHSRTNNGQYRDVSRWAPP